MSRKEMEKGEANDIKTTIKTTEIYKEGVCVKKVQMERSEEKSGR